MKPRLALAIVLVAALVAAGCTSDADYQTIAEEIVDREATAAPESAAPTTDPGSEVYVVRRGDTLASIARAQGSAVTDLAAANAIDDIDLIEVGQRLIVPRQGDASAAAGARVEAPEAAESLEAASSGDAPVADEPGLFSAIPSRLDLEGVRGPAYVLLLIGGVLTATAALAIVLVAAWGGLGHVSRVIRATSEWLLRRSHAVPAARRLARWLAAKGERILGGARTRVAAVAMRARRRVGAALPDRLAELRSPAVSFRGRARGVSAGDALRHLGRGAGRLALWFGVVAGGALRWSGRAGYRGANRTARQGRATAERALEQRREQRRAQERAAELERLAGLGVAQLRLGLLDEAEAEIRAAMAGFDPLDAGTSVERGVCLVRLAEVLIRRDDHSGAARCLGDGLDAMGADGPAQAYQQVQTLRLRLRAAASAEATLAAR
jgi:LysM repeat protein